MSDLPKGFMSNVDIETALDIDIVICDYDKQNLTDIGYNLTATDFIFSINKGLLVPIINHTDEKYCYVNPHDTVLILTREAIWVSENISGTFHSKVRIVSQGFGHIGTTLDAFWEGPLLIALNNPTNKKLKFIIGKYGEDGKIKYSSFVTLVFYRMASPTTMGHDNPPCRLDILKSLVSKPKYVNLRKKEYDKLEQIVAVISAFENLHVGIGKALPEERKENIEKFKEKYRNFAENVGYQISQAHKISNKILLSEKIIGIIFWMIIIAPAVALCYLAYDAVQRKESGILAQYTFFFTVYAWVVNTVKDYMKGDK